MHGPLYCGSTYFGYTYYDSTYYMVIAYLSAGQHGQAILTMALLTISMTSPPLIDRLACLFPSLQRGAGTELVVEMQDLLNVPHAFAVLHLLSNELNN